jgi:hypothetical protein
MIRRRAAEFPAEFLKPLTAKVLEAVGGSGRQARRTENRKVDRRLSDVYSPSRLRDARGKLRIVKRGHQRPFARERSPRAQQKIERPHGVGSLQGAQIISVRGKRIRERDCLVRPTLHDAMADQLLHPDPFS